MEVLTCNIRWCGADDGENSWAHRKDVCIDVIRAQSPDIICFQEMWQPQFADLAAAFPGHRHYGMADAPTGRHCPLSIFYRADAFMCLSAGGYWLSDRPHVAGSSAWESACVRLANWVRLEERLTHVEFRVINTHLDHISQPARENQARLVAEDAAAYPPEYAQVLTGDMNADSRNPALGPFRREGWFDTYDRVHGNTDPGPTHHAFLGPRFRPAEGRTGKIDWIFARGNIRVLEAAVVRDSSDGRFPSDHYFVSACLELVPRATEGERVLER